jgi:hypothetical protein
MPRMADPLSDVRMNCRLPEGGHGAGMTAGAQRGIPLSFREKMPWPFSLSRAVRRFGHHRSRARADPPLLRHAEITQCPRGNI